MRYSDRKALEIAEKIAKATNREIKIDITHSIGGNRHQATAGIDGKTITLGRGLLEKLDDDELASIIAHEVAHHEKREEKRQNNSTEKEKNIGELLEKMDQDLKNSEAGGIFRTVAQIATVGLGVIGGILISKGSSRINEIEADKRAVEILNKSGFRSDAGADAFEKTDNGRGLRRGFIEQILATHPQTNERIEEIRKYAERIEEETTEDDECCGDCDDPEIECEDCSCPVTCCDECQMPDENRCHGDCEDPEISCEECTCSESCCAKCHESDPDYEDNSE